MGRWIVSNDYYRAAGTPRVGREREREHGEEEEEEEAAAASDPFPASYY